MERCIKNALEQCCMLYIGQGRGKEGPGQSPLYEPAAGPSRARSALSRDSRFARRARGPRGGRCDAAGVRVVCDAAGVRAHLAISLPGIEIPADLNLSLSTTSQVYPAEDLSHVLNTGVSNLAALFVALGARNKSLEHALLQKDDSRHMLHSNTVNKNIANWIKLSP
jgi:hypothetical protein